MELSSFHDKGRFVKYYDPNFALSLFVRVSIRPSLRPFKS